MSTYDSYDIVDGAPRRHKSHRHRRDRDDYDADPRYVETQETYVRGSPAPFDPPYNSRTTELVRRPVREDSDLSIEEVRRDFPPPAAAPLAYRDMYRDDRYGPPRARSADRGSQYGAYLGDPRRSDQGLDDRRSRKKYVKEEIEEPRRRSLSRNQKIIAAVAGGVLAAGGKELFDRRGDFKHAPAHRNLLGTAAVGAAGAFAGYEGAEYYAKHVGKEHKKEKTYVAYEGKDGEVAEYYSSGEETERKKPSRRKSLVDSALALAGVGAAAKAVGHGDDRSDRRSRRYDSDDEYDDRRTSGRKSRRGSGERSRRGSPEGAAKFQQAAKAALLAGATEAFRVRKEPGSWSGAKGKRILTAAIGASAIDAAADRNPDKHSKRHVLEAVIGGLAGNHLVNGSRKEIDVDEDGRSVSGRSRSRARSRSRGPGGSGGGAGLAALATAGIGALAGKKLLDRSRSRSRAGGDDRRRRYSSSDDGRRGPGKRSRSKSVTDMARKGLAAIGIGEAAEAVRDDRRDRDGRRDVVEETYVKRKSRRHRGDSDDDYDNSRGYRDGPDAPSGYASSRGDPYGYDDRQDDRRDDRPRDDRPRKKAGQKAKKKAEGKASSDSSSDLGSSTDDEKREKKMKGKQLLTAGLAAVATIHAAHSVYQSVEKRNERHKAVKEGEMSPEEAHKLKVKARLQDAASIGIAALGIKGAISEWKEMREMRKECNEFESKKGERHRKRLERQAKLKNGSSGDNKAVGMPVNRRPQSSSAPDLAYNGRDGGGGPRYIDDNPYSAAPLPPPPMGYGYQGR
ncbi:MAG: hypothetical protein M1818_006615 [Claussenomyces sp. TS43310]|nr:MAG: hypothetical protein M1818_006950 [Claussenomyces sp. TS43310]KAI9735038.1 MAG: hypothetical protein M1818_006615 [Claussenomyces sp. TS43310]